MNTPVSTTDLDTIKELVNLRLKTYYETRQEEARQLGSGYVTLWNSIGKLFQAGGKRLRPYMLITAYKAYAPDKPIEAIMPAAIAQELVHVAMLIHDDIIDRDTIRYGIKNVTGQYLDFYSSFISEAGENRHMAESSAILAGDILLSDTYRLLAQCQVSQESLSKAIDIMSRGVFEVVGGELLDTEGAFIYDPLVTAHTIARYKTASYSFISPILSGATLAGADDAELKTLQTIAENLGIGYQLQDDLLGVFGDEGVTGKSTSTDIVEGKRTYLIELFETLASEAQKEEFATIFHNADATEGQITEARNLLIDSGARASVENELVRISEDSARLIGELSIDEASRSALLHLVEMCLNREL